MRKHGRTDANQTAIVAALRAIPGVRVRSTASVGDGFPDLAVGYKGRTYLMELKDGSLPPSKRQLTKDEELFFHSWTGDASVVESINDALLVIGVKYE